MNKKRPNRMVKDNPIERQEEDVTPATEQEEPVATDIPPSYPCKYCQGETKVTRSFPAMETSQVPVKVIKRRHRQCIVCRRQFSTQEESFKQ